MIDDKLLDEYIAKCKERDKTLLKNIKGNLPRLKELLEKCNNHWGTEDDIYRFYHYSFKVYSLQHITEEITKELESMAPTNYGLCKLYKDIIKEGTGKKFEMNHNEKWAEMTRPMVEAYFHAHYFLSMAVKYGEELEDAVNVLPSGWAALLELYGIR
ncbi:MAG: hypothetical protein KGO96_06780 [Elusimicrobia bacterium]|nr:hypothetical protein [Elusimicrobiota bacterium]